MAHISFAIMEVVWVVMAIWYSPGLFILSAIRYRFQCLDWALFSSGYAPHIFIIKFNSQAIPAVFCSAFRNVVIPFHRSLLLPEITVNPWLGLNFQVVNFEAWLNFGRTSSNCVQVEWGREGGLGGLFSSTWRKPRKLLAWRCSLKLGTLSRFKLDDPGTWTRT
jgi:hypothetical protein